MPLGQSVYGLTPFPEGDYIAMVKLILEVVEGGRSGRQLTIRGTVEMGRDPSSTLVLQDEQVSRRHARIWLSDGVAGIEDLGSVNGTYVNDQPVRAARRLAPGDRVRLGMTVLQVRSAEDVAGSPSAVAPIPPISHVGHDVLRPIEDPPPAPASHGTPLLRARERAPAFVPPEAVGDQEAESNFRAVAALVDSRVRRRTNTAMLALLAASGLAVLVVLGIR